MQSDMRYNPEPDLRGASRRAGSVPASVAHAAENVTLRPLLSQRRLILFGGGSYASAARADNDSSVRTDHRLSFEAAGAGECADFVSPRLLRNAAAAGLFEAPASFAPDSADAGYVISARTNTAQGHVACNEDHETYKCLSPRPDFQNGSSKDMSFGFFSPTLHSPSACFGPSAIDLICGTKETQQNHDDDGCVGAVNTEVRSTQQGVLEACKRVRKPPALGVASSGCVRRTSWPTVHAPYGRPDNPHASPRSAGDPPAKRWSFDASARLVDPVDGTFYNIADEVLVKQDCSVPPPHEVRPYVSTSPTVHSDVSCSSTGGNRSSAARNEPLFCPPRLARNADAFYNLANEALRKQDCSAPPPPDVRPYFGSAPTAQTDASCPSICRKESPFCPPRLARNADARERAQPQTQSAESTVLQGSSPDPQLAKFPSPYTKIYAYNLNAGAPFEAQRLTTACNELGHLSKDPKKVSLYKTELCRSFVETGSCRYGPKCQFAHGTEELRSVERHPKHKSVMCKTFWEKGECPYGQRCCFIHTRVPSEQGEVSIQSRAAQANVSNGGGEAVRPPLSGAGRSAATAASLTNLYRLEDDAVNATINASVVAPRNADDQPADSKNAAGPARANRTILLNGNVRGSLDESDRFVGRATEHRVSPPSEISASFTQHAANGAHGTQNLLQPPARPGRPARFAAGGVRRLRVFQSMEL